MDGDVPNDVQKLSTMISSLSDIQSRLDTLRNVPPLLLKSSLPFSSLSIRKDFDQLKQLADAIRSDPIQEALSAAAASEKADKRPPSPPSPQPYIPYDKRGTSLFPPPTDDDPPPLPADDLPDYIRQFNRTRPCKLHIWTRIRGATQLTNPAIVRFTIPDVLVSYITMAYTTADPVLVTESVTAFGPREKSDFLVYQSFSQEIARMLQTHPRVSFQTLVDLMCAYEGIFIDRCTSCERVLSAEGHVPPVVRVWVDGKAGDKGKWEPRHASCSQT
ncbi:hypothetical protein C8R46DRAFT_1054624 [Mycena filopes]|nr:hypothetical protein C8R46DRAFT_1054624 [Mycena filopes]